MITPPLSLSRAWPPFWWRIFSNFPTCCTLRPFLLVLSLGTREDRLPHTPGNCGAPQDLFNSPFFPLAVLGVPGRWHRSPAAPRSLQALPQPREGSGDTRIPFSSRSHLRSSGSALLTLPHLVSGCIFQDSNEHRCLLNIQGNPKVC